MLLLTAASSTAVAQEEDVTPERATAVTVSNRDVNRINCPFGITEVYWSQEKPVTVSQQPENVFVKFLVRRAGTMETRATDPVDIHVVCGGDVYTMILHPRDMDSKTVRLGNTKRKQLQSAAKEWGAIPLEEQVKKLTLAVFRNELPNTLERSPIAPSDPRRNVDVFENAEIVGQSEVVVTGTGLRAVEYVVIAREAMTLQEKDFLVRELGNIVAVTLDPLVLPKGGAARLIVVERSASRD